MEAVDDALADETLQGCRYQVYEAEDLVVGDTIALKTLREEMSASSEAVESLRREIALARKVTHSNSFFSEGLFSVGALIDGRISAAEGNVDGGLAKQFANSPRTVGPSATD
jgi:serine/threonine protein kinase